MDPAATANISAPQSANVSPIPKFHIVSDFELNGAHMQDVWLPLDVRTGSTAVEIGSDQLFPLWDLKADVAYEEIVLRRSNSLE